MKSIDGRKTGTATLAVAATFALLTLAACGGGGGKGPTSMMPSDGGGGGQMPGGGSTPTIPTRAEALTDSVAAANAFAKIARATAAQPAPGSVTQSSNVDSSNVSTDRVHITAQYGSGIPSFSVRNGTAWSISTSEGNPSRISGTPPLWRGVELRKRIAGGTLYVDAYTDIEAPTQVTTGGTYAFTFRTINVGGTYTHENSSISGLSAVLDGVTGTVACTGCSFVYTTGQLQMTAGSMTFTPSDGTAATTLTAGTVTNTVADADYLAGGVWLIVPDDVASAAGFEFGAFADGSDPFMQSSLAAVTGTATYTGDATGVYSAKEAGDFTGGFLNADVRLTANFGDANGLGTINGSITNFALDGTPVTGTLNLGTASIGAQNSGFFRGAVTGADSQRSYTGHWGGQFFGNGQADGRPGSVAGTFGGHSTDDVVSFVGAFGARKQ